MRKTPSRPGAVERGPLATLVTAGLVTWFGVTVLSQHPQPLFDRFRRYDITGLLIGNWRFFAPEPAQHDFHVLHRVLTADGEQTPWAETTEIPKRHWRQVVWFPERRQDKAVFDICADLIVHLGQPHIELTKTTAFEVLRDFVELTVRREYAGDRLPKGFQFVIARSAGYDESHDPDYLLVSPFVPMKEGQPA
ncbi:hypothetical protein GCM10027280_49000 [Micromonospora polyrhachis]|uniref:Uncharacterized protein n=1 Tax=Micromonospora polyrhachis TaxID=1282883 RepID=A0A7W7WSJ2_9ACTN|nr:hypothetical protein [Micromonospora polyrhachis]MBB4962180.1 hypothetical protein [Micromonospora polyrhachis]